MASLAKPPVVFRGWTSLQLPRFAAVLSHPHAVLELAAENVMSTQILGKSASVAVERGNDVEAD